MKRVGGEALQQGKTPEDKNENYRTTVSEMHGMTMSCDQKHDPQCKEMNQGRKKWERQTTAMREMIETSLCLGEGRTKQSGPGGRKDCKKDEAGGTDECRRHHSR